MDASKVPAVSFPIASKCLPHEMWCKLVETYKRGDMLQLELAISALIVVYGDPTDMSPIGVMGSDE